MDAARNSSPDDLITVNGGIDGIEVEHRDGSKEIVKVLEIPIRNLGEFAKALGLGDELAQVEIYCDKPKGWGETLTNTSANQILNEGQRVNLPFFEDWCRRQFRWMESQKPGALRELEKTLTDAIAVSSRSGNSPQPSPITTN